MNLTKNERILILLLSKNEAIQLSNTNFNQDEFNKASWGLKDKGLVDTHESDQEGCFVTFITDHGKAFLVSNPNAKNPYLTENRKFIIRIIVDVILCIISYFIGNILPIIPR